MLKLQHIGMILDHRVNYMVYHLVYWYHMADGVVYHMIRQMVYHNVYHTVHRMVSYITWSILYGIPIPPKTPTRETRSSAALLR